MFLHEFTFVNTIVFLITNRVYESNDWCKSLVTYSGREFLLAGFVIHVIATAGRNTDVFLQRIGLWGTLGDDIDETEHFIFTMKGAEHDLIVPSAVVAVFRDAWEALASRDYTEERWSSIIRSAQACPTDWSFLTCHLVVALARLDMPSEKVVGQIARGWYQQDAFAGDARAITLLEHFALMANDRQLLQRFYWEPQEQVTLPDGTWVPTFPVRRYALHPPAAGEGD